MIWFMKLKYSFSDRQHARRLNLALWHNTWRRVRYIPTVFEGLENKGDGEGVLPTRVASP